MIKFKIQNLPSLGIEIDFYILSLESIWLNKHSTRSPYRYKNRGYIEINLGENKIARLVYVASSKK